MLYSPSDLFIASGYPPNPKSVFSWQRQVEVSHNYFVSPHKLWVHNAGDKPCSCQGDSCSISQVEGTDKVDDLDGIAIEIGILREAAQGKGNFGLGAVNRAEAEKLGYAWVGEGAKWSSNGKALISKDGLRQYRPPTAKPNSSYATTGVPKPICKVDQSLKAVGKTMAT